MSKINKGDYEKHLEAMESSRYFKAIVKCLLEEQKRADIGLYSPPFVYAPIGRFKTFSHFLKLEGDFEPQFSSKSILAVNKTNLICPKALPELLPYFINHRPIIQAVEKETAISCPAFAFCEDELWLVAVIDSIDGKNSTYKLNLLREYIIRNAASGDGLALGNRVIKIESERVQVKEYHLIITPLEKWREEDLVGCSFTVLGGIKPYERNLERVKTFFLRTRRVDEIFSNGDFHRTESEIREGLWYLGKGYADKGAKEMANLKKAFKTAYFFS